MSKSIVDSRSSAPPGVLPIAVTMYLRHALIFEGIVIENSAGTDLASSLMPSGSSPTTPTKEIAALVAETTRIFTVCPGLTTEPFAGDSILSSDWPVWAKLRAGATTTDKKQSRRRRTLIIPGSPQMFTTIFRIDQYLNCSAKLP
jgi:hypothetical protein